MAEIIIFGVPQSSYVRTVRFTCGEKSVPHRLEPIQLGSDAHLALHPWRKVPIMRHGELQLFETSAIVRYIDEAFPGPALTPDTPVERGVMEQWISTINSYMYGHLVRDYALAYLLPMMSGQEPDMARIQAAIPDMQRDLAILDQGYADREWIAGHRLSLADMFVAPIVATVGMCPEGAAALEKCPNLMRAFGAMEQRLAYKAAQPQA